MKIKFTTDMTIIIIRILIDGMALLPVTWITWRLQTSGSLVSDGGCVARSGAVATGGRWAGGRARRGARDTASPGAGAAGAIPGMDIPEQQFMSKGGKSYIADLRKCI